MRPHSGPALPTSLLEELETSSGQYRHYRPYPLSSYRMQLGALSGPKKFAGRNLKVSRKEARKQGRSERKQRKVEFYSSSHAHVKRTAEGEHEHSPQRKKPKLSSDHPDTSPQKTRLSKPSTSDTKLSKKKSDSSRSTFSHKTSNDTSRSFPRTHQEEDEDRYIAYLEAKLGWSKGGKRAKNYGRGLDEDGLDGTFHPQSHLLQPYGCVVPELLRDLDNIESTTFGQQQVSRPPCVTHPVK